ncbi:MAG: hypothetical protein WCE48_01560 [Steroidobacteraceae bacterium]
MQYRSNILCLLVTALALCAGACTTRSYAPGSEAATRELRIRVGSEIRIVTIRRERITFKVTAVGSDRFIGVTVTPHAKETRAAGAAIEVPFEDLAMLEVTRAEAKTVVLAVVTVSVFAAVVSAIPVAGFPPP